jgi:hypothetical protein
MKKALFIISIVCLLAGLAACSSSPAATSTSQASTSALSTSYTNALSVNMQLLVGTFSLDGTTNAVDAATAKTLLPLWKAAKTLSSSDATAAEELSAVSRQIEEAMTPARIQAIAALNLTQQNVAALSMKMGLSAGGPTRQSTSQAGGAAQGMPADAAGMGGGGGGVPPAGGGMPADGGGMPGGGQGGATRTGSTSSSSTTSNSQASTTKTGNSATALYDAVIALLQSKIN